MRLAAVCAALLLCGAALSACGSEAAPTPPPTATPVAGPAVGACHQMSYDDALAATPDSAPVDCAGPHTSETIAAGDFPLLAGGHVADPASTASEEHASAQCRAALTAYLGATEDQLRLTTIRSVWFTPAQSDVALGANWFRCDAIAIQGDDLATLTGSLQGVFAAGAWQDYALCGTGQPGADGSARVLCREPHTWAAIRAVDVTPAEGGGYPGSDAAQAAGQQVCKEAGQQVASNALDFQWGYEWPTEEQWQAGQTYGLCWAPSA